MPRKSLSIIPTWRTIATLYCAALLPADVAADGTERVGRYLDRSVLVHEAAQLNPLEQVVDIEIDSRVTVAEALRLALAGTGYGLVDLEDHPDPESRDLLRGRVAIPHESFNRKRVDSVIAALIGEGRGFYLHVDHVARRIRVVPISPAIPVAPSVRVRHSSAYRPDFSHSLHFREGHRR